MAVKILWLSNLIVILDMMTAYQAVTDSEWLAYKNKYQLSFGIDEDSLRREIYEENVRYIRQHNEKNRGFRLGVNGFSHMNHSELVSMNPEQPIKRPRRNDVVKLHNVSKILGIPPTVDWRMMGAVTSVKSQRNCLTSAVFSAIGSIEGAYYIRNNKLVSFSPQQIVDCNTYTEGCSGISLPNVFDYITENGIMSEKFYKYKAIKGKCRYNSTKVVTRIKSYERLPKNDNALVVALATIGPISSTILVSPKDFYSYKDGIYYINSNLPHIMYYHVTVVGYGTDITNGKEQEYYLLKNSLGTGWGLEGFMKLARTRENLIQPSRDALYPIF